MINSMHDLIVIIKCASVEELFYKHINVYNRTGHRGQAFKYHLCENVHTTS